EPNPVAAGWSAEVCREITISNAFVSAERPAAARYGEHDRLAGQLARLCVIRCVVHEPIAALPRDDVENGALDVAVLGGRSHGLDLQLLNEVDTRLGQPSTTAGTREVGAIDQEQVLV